MQGKSVLKTQEKTNILYKQFFRRTSTCKKIISISYTSEDFDDGMTDKDMYNNIKEKMNEVAEVIKEKVSSNNGLTISQILPLITKRLILPTVQTSTQM